MKKSSVTLVKIILLCLVFSPSWSLASEKKKLAMEVVKQARFDEVYRNSSELRVAGLANFWAEANVSPYWIEAAVQHFSQHLKDPGYGGNVARLLEKKSSERELNRVLEFYNSKAGRELTKSRTGDISPEEITTRVARLAAANFEDYDVRRLDQIRKISFTMDTSTTLRWYVASVYLTAYLQARSMQQEPPTFEAIKNELDANAAVHGWLLGTRMLAILIAETFDTPDKNLRSYAKFLAKKILANSITYLSAMKRQY